MRDLLLGLKGLLSRRAVEKIHRQADGGNAAAMTSLAAMYFNGEGVPRSLAEAKKWLRKAAEHGDATAQHKLGLMYDYGTDGMPTDEAKAVEWYRKAAEKGNAGAQFMLGAKYSDGEGVPKDEVEAHTWFNLAGASGDEKARKARTRLEAKMSREQVAEAQRLALERFEKYKQE